MKACERLADEKKQLSKLQVAYKQHLAYGGHDRLRWLERSIDMQQEAVMKLTIARDEIHPFGCVACQHYSRCPYSG